MAVLSKYQYTRLTPQGFHLFVQASPSALAFYGSAIHTLRIQVAALSTAAIFWIAQVVALEPQLGGIGAHTPVLPLSIMVSEPNVSIPCWGQNEGHQQEAKY